MSVTVIMSCYNSQSTVSKAIESILNQTYQNIKLLICDDGSIDETNKVISEYEELDNRVKCYKNVRNIGLTKSLNFLISKANTDYIARQDGDDFSLENRIEMQLNELKKENLDFVTTRAKVISKDRLIPGLSFYLPDSFLMNFKNPFIHGSLLIKKDVLNIVGNYDENFYYAQDYKLFTDLIAKGFKYSTLNYPFYNLNIKDNISNKFIIEQEYYAKCVRNNKIPNKLFK